VKDKVIQCLTSHLHHILQRAQNSGTARHMHTTHLHTKIQTRRRHYQGNVLKTEWINAGDWIGDKCWEISIFPKMITFF